MHIPSSSSRLRWACLALSLFFGVGAAPAEAASDRSAAAANGKKVATRVCAGCHDVSDDLKAATARRPGVPPPLRTIAQSPELNADLLLEFLWFPHGEMDNLRMTRREADDVADFIMSMRRK